MTKSKVDETEDSRKRKLGLRLHENFPCKQKKRDHCNSINTSFNLFLGGWMFIFTSRLSELMRIGLLPTV